MKRTETIELEQGLENLAREKRWYGCEEITIGFYGNGHGNEICDYILMDSKGIIRCYELKVTKQDLKSHAKKSWYGNYNYLVVTDSLYEKIVSQGESWNDYLPDGVGLMVGYESYEYIQDEMDTEILDIFDFNERINYKKRNSKKVIRFYTKIKPIKKNLLEKEQLMLTQSMIRSMNYKIIKYKDANNLDNLNKAKKTAQRYERLYEDKVKEKSAYEPYAFSHKNFLQDYEANNWLKAHGIPMRRKPFKRKFVTIALDEFSNIINKELS